MKVHYVLFFLAFAFPMICFGRANALSDKKDSISDKAEAFRLTCERGVELLEGVFDNNLSTVHRTDKAYRIFGGFFQQLSTAGSSGQNLVFGSGERGTHAYLPDLFEPYTYTFENAAYYQVSKARSNLRYSDNTNSFRRFSIFHTQNLTDTWNIGLNYDVNYADGTFAYSQVMNQFFNLTSNYVSRNGRYHVAAAYIRNRAYILENGGILSDSLFINSLYSKPETYPTNLQNAYSKYKTSDFSLYQSYRLSSNQENESKIFNAGKLTHQIKFLRAARIYSDEMLLLPDSIATRSLQNSLFWTNENDSSSQILPLQIGVKHELLMFSDRTNSPLYNIITPQVRMGFRHGNFEMFSSYAYSFATERYTDDYTVDLEAVLHFCGNRISLYVASKRQTPYYIYSHFESENLNWDREITKTNNTQLKASYCHKDLLTLNLNYFLLDKYPTINSSDLSISYGDKINLVQAQVLFGKDWKRFGMQGNYVVQHTDAETCIHLPLFMAKQSLYLRFNLFKGKLETLVGLDLRYNTAYYADRYMPQIGIFAFQDEEQTGNYLYCDIFVNARIDACNLFLALTHPYAGAFGNSYIPTPLYPTEGFALCWGLSWNLMN